MKWYTEFDDNDNRCYEACSIYHDDGSHFKYRLTQVLRGNRIHWVLETSDAEVFDAVMECESWKTADAAKKWVARREAECIRFEKQLQKTVADPLNSKPLIWDND